MGGCIAKNSKKKVNKNNRSMRPAPVDNNQIKSSTHSMEPEPSSSQGIQYNSTPKTKEEKEAFRELQSRELHTACQEENLGAVKELLNKKADVNIPVVAGTNIYMIHIACMKGNTEILNLLVNKGKADVNVVDDNSWTPLIISSKGAHLDSVKYLISQKADILMVSNENKDALQIASEELSELRMEGDDMEKVDRLEQIISILEEEKSRCVGLNNISNKYENKREALVEESNDESESEKSYVEEEPVNGLAPNQV